MFVVFVAMADKSSLPVPQVSDNLIYEDRALVRDRSTPIVQQDYSTGRLTTTLTLERSKLALPFPGYSHPVPPLLPFCCGEALTFRYNILNVDRLFTNGKL